MTVARLCSASQTMSGRSSEAGNKRQRRDPEAELEEEEEQEDARASMETAAHAHLPLTYVNLKVKQQVILQLPLTQTHLTWHISNSCAGWRGDSFQNEACHADRKGSIASLARYFFCKRRPHTTPAAHRFVLPAQISGLPRCLVLIVVFLTAPHNSCCCVQRRIILFTAGFLHQPLLITRRFMFGGNIIRAEATPKKLGAWSRALF
jgi:hypothetical protein